MDLYTEITMPDWTSNKLQIIGDREDCESFMSFCNGENGVAFAFSKIIASPTNLKTDNAFLSWCTRNWGTKWPACECGNWDGYECEDGKYLFWINFKTAWNRPLPLILRASKLFRSIKFVLFAVDEFSDFVDADEIEEGKVISQKGWKGSKKLERQIKEYVLS